MIFKRIYDKPEGWQKKVNVKNSRGLLLEPAKSEGACLNLPPLKHIVLKSAPPRQVFSEKILMRGMMEGWLRVDGDRIILKSYPKETIYQIKRRPGIYCLHNMERQPSQEAARAHILTTHCGYGQDELPADDEKLTRKFWEMLKAKNYKSPVEDSPAGYCQVNGYDCMKIS